MKKTPCTGHLCFWGDLEYFEVNGRVWEAPSKNGVDPEGYRYGAKSYVYREMTPAEFMKEIQKTIDEYPNGYMWRIAVHSEDYHLFTHPDPDGKYGSFETEMTELFPKGVSISRKESMVKVMVREEYGVQVMEILEQIPGFDFDKHWGGYYWLYFPFGSIQVALDRLRLMESKPSVIVPVS